MIFDTLILNDKQFDVEGQLRIKENHEVKIIFEDLDLGTYLKELPAGKRNIGHLELRNTEKTRYDTKGVDLTHITIDGKHFHATFK